MLEQIVNEGKKREKKHFYFTLSAAVLALLVTATIARLYDLRIIKSPELAWDCIAIGIVICGFLACIAAFFHARMDNLDRLIVEKKIYQMMKMRFSSGLLFSTISKEAA